MPAARLGRAVTGIGGALLAVLVAFFAAAAWFGEGHGASLSKFAQVRPGMTRADVVKLLGCPETVNGPPGGAEAWFYTRNTFCQVKVYMTADGVVENTDHDH